MIAALAPAALALAAIAVLVLTVRHLTADDRHYTQHMKGHRP
ncbi:hypothetical protein ACFS27_03210 [Promicromonospora vindobonensis]|uniref:Uncharacterized protein n=1 Tax=Promicromonospora vindobonensis TaxID=195748 RepID=A0ABW5VLL5_9MICO